MIGYFIIDYIPSKRDWSLAWAIIGVNFAPDKFALFICKIQHQCVSGCGVKLVILALLTFKIVTGKYNRVPEFRLYEN